MALKSLPNDDSTTAAMKFFGIPLTRQNYIEWAFGGQKITPEMEAELPKRFQLPVEDAPSALEEVMKKKEKGAKTK